MNRYFKKIKILIVCSLLSILCFGCAFSVDDAHNYVNAALNATFLGDYEEFSSLRKVDEATLQKEMEEDFVASLSQELADIGEIPQDQMDTYIQLRRKMKQLAVFEVGEATKDGEVFKVNVTITPSNIFITYAQKASSLMTEKLEAGSTMQEAGEIMHVINEALEYAIEQNTYLAETSVTVNVFKTEEEVWVISDEDLQLLDEALFPIS